MQILEQVQDLPKAGNIKAQWVSLWTGPVVGVVLLIAFLAFPGFRPPMSPLWSAEQVAGVLRRPHRVDPVQQVTFNLCGIMILPFFMVIVVADETHEDPEPRLRLLLPDRSRQRRNHFRAVEHLLPGRGVPADPQSRADHGAQRPGVDRVHRPGRHGRHPVRAARPRGLLRRWARSGLPALGGPLLAGDRDRDGAGRGGCGGDRADRWPGTVCCRSGCATARSRCSSSSCSSCCAARCSPGTSTRVWRSEPAGACADHRRCRTRRQTRCAPGVLVLSGLVRGLRRHHLRAGPGHPASAPRRHRRRQGRVLRRHTV